jgi:hypothetical protein
MKTFIRYDADGVIRNLGTCSDAETPSAIAGLSSLAVSPSIDAANSYVSGGVVLAYTSGQRAARATPPNDSSVWSNATMSWSDPRTLQEHKDAKWELIKQSREAAFNAPLTTPYGTFDSDAESRTRITDAVLMAQTLAGMGQPAAIDFTLADNSVVTLDATQMVTVGLLLGAKIQAAFATGRSLRTAIYAATTVVQVQAINWP